MTYTPLNLQNLSQLTLADEQKIPNPWSRQNWNLTHQMQIEAHSPALAKSLKTKAQSALEARQREIKKLLTDRKDINERLQQLGHQEPRFRR
jgi:hypothetical protein